MASQDELSCVLIVERLAAGRSSHRADQLQRKSNMEGKRRRKVKATHRGEEEERKEEEKEEGEQERQVEIEKEEKEG
eukprot:754095-Hanusia_phi.AAC.1